MPDSSEGGPISSLMRCSFCKHLHKCSVDFHGGTVYKNKQQKLSLVQSSFFFSSSVKRKKNVCTLISSSSKKLCKIKLIKCLLYWDLRIFSPLIASFIFPHEKQHFISFLPRFVSLGKLIPFTEFDRCGSVSLIRQ